ncbi:MULTISPECIES: hypothetical protein [unclassified Pseudomonas]|uniref:hypothetical protein n=1 Tax=unclassified Pseudomonas TaxID=196821 RepID=UPI0002A1A4C7|nr:MULTISPECIES: hypothetical protein [unclassified Pseudomonas]MBB1606524.1 hypothetical protein [Pseudomonas sp. UMC76]MBB1640703.1 hypothetical protein [Pseudomonas sp. UME83]NTX88163.1 hypothetical protein [Pseudomonas sp. UMA643]NTY18736.1 hypothetical protein [Pseudomonas sp. UMC3103]NTY23960.1 hypothetical protein [Pseudomonas sp. UMA603]
MTKFLKKFLFAFMLMTIAAAISVCVMVWVSFISDAGFRGLTGFLLAVGPELLIAAAGFAWVEVRRG